MSADLQPMHGDIVHVKGVVRKDDYGRGPLVIDVSAYHSVPLAMADIVSVEKTTFSVGDRVIAGHMHGEILCVADNQLWVRPDSGNRVPSTFDAALCRREPAPPPSAGILPFQERDNPESFRPSDSEAAG